MGSRLLLLGGLLAVASLLVVGCAGDADEIDESESPLTVPPPTAESPTADAVLDLETMTDEELLAEAERAYQGFLDDVAEMRLAGDEDYSELDTWATGAFLERAQEVYVDNFPSHLVIQDVQELAAVALANPGLTTEGRVQAVICLDNSPVRVLDQDGTDVTDTEGAQYSSGLAEFELAPDSSHLRVVRESDAETDLPEPCS